MTNIALNDICAALEAFRPPKRLTVAEAVAQTLYIRQPGGYNGYWSPDETPYMVEPMNMLASRRHEAVCFVGPARTGKTEGLLDGWMSYAVTCDPGDMLIVQQSQEKAREFSKTRISRALESSQALSDLMSVSAQDHNTHDIMFKHGMWLRLGWPTRTQLSGSDYRYVALTDYDRMDDIIDGESSAFGMGLKRTQTFLSRGMCVVESSPGRNITDPNWKPATKHEAPPCTGILGIYNRSDRRRFYWRCPSCSEHFEAAPGIELFRLPSDKVLIEEVRHVDIEEIVSEHSSVICPHCEAKIAEAKKRGMNSAGRWVIDGQVILSNGKVEGDPLTSTIAGYWLGGVAAAFQYWPSLVRRYLSGLRDYALSGAEETLKDTVTLDQGTAYLPRILADAANRGEGPESRKDKTLERFIVPEWARFLVATVDVQGGSTARFVVQVHAIGPYLEQCVIDRFTIRDSKRKGFVQGEYAAIDPASYGEDWDTLRDLVLNATYRLSEEGKEMRVKMMAVDSGGEDGVTDKAYDFYRRMRTQGFAPRVMLVKGASAKTAPMIRESMVGAKKKEECDIPLYTLNPNLILDAVYASLKRPVPGPGYIHIADWLPQAWFDELASEVRQPNGVYKQIRARNETPDLLKYCRVACMRLGADKPKFWENPPDWAKQLSQNSMVITREMRREMQAGNAEPAAVMRRRAVRSSYLK